MLPNLIVIGAAKCGTTSLHRYLDLHPEIAMTKAKELDFFVEDRNWQRGLGWYESQFRPGPDPRRKLAALLVLSGLCGCSRAHGRRHP